MKLIHVFCRHMMKRRRAIGGEGAAGGEHRFWALCKGQMGCVTAGVSPERAAPRASGDFGIIAPPERAAFLPAPHKERAESLRMLAHREMPSSSITASVAL